MAPKDQLHEAELDKCAYLAKAFVKTSHQPVKPKQVLKRLRGLTGLVYNEHSSPEFLIGITRLNESLDRVSRSETIKTMKPRFLIGHLIEQLHQDHPGCYWSEKIAASLRWASQL